MSHLKKSKEPEQPKLPKKDTAYLFVKAVGILIVILIAVVIVKFYIAASIQNDTTIIVQKKLGIQPFTKDYDIIGDNGIRYTIAGNQRLFEEKVTIAAEDRFNKFQEGGMFTIHTHGIYFPALGMYPNIITIQQALSIEKPCPKNETLEQNHPEGI